MSAGLEQVAAALSSAKEPTEVPLGNGKTVRVLPPMKWRQSAMRALRVGDYEAWAAKCLVNDLAQAEDGSYSGSDDGAVFIDADLTNEELIAFVQAYADAAGQALGE